MKIFKEAYNLLEKDWVNLDWKSEKGIFYMVKDYSFKIYLKSSTWFSQCGCRAGIFSKPTILCKHHIAVIVSEFLKQNKLKLVKDE